MAELQNDDRVVVVGGGPAGSFFAILLLREARRLGRRIEVVIIEKRCPTADNADVFLCRGCTFCAGGISPRLNEILEHHSLRVPEEIIQERIEYVWIHGQWKNFRLRVPKDKQMYSVFRGSLPGRRVGTTWGFDDYLRSEAVREGARILHGEVRSISGAASGRPSLEVRKSPEESVWLDAGFVTVATGINTRCGLDYSDDVLISSIKRFSPGFVAGESRQTLIFELDTGEQYLRRHMSREVHFIEYGSKKLDLEHTALVPKGRFLTVAMIGRCVDEASLPRDGPQIIRDFLKLPQIERILPGIEEAPVACACVPRMTVTAARHPFGHRFAIVGDAVGARLNKDGLFSAYVTGSRLAHTVLHEGVDRAAIARGYGSTVKWLAADNRYGRLVFGLSRVAFTGPMVSRLMYQAFATEFKVRDERDRPFSAVLWKIASGTADYREVLREMYRYRVLRSVLLGAAVTVRNVMLEGLLGLQWGEYGRYPTVVLKEKRAGLKQRLASSLGMELAAARGFERMYVIKIRGAADEILEELAKFGRPEAKFLRLRLMQVQWLRGVPNQVGSVIRYKLPATGLSAELRLTRRVGSETLLYELDDRLCDQGKLIFNVGPAKDGNSRLSIYAALDFKRGKGFAGRILWGAARAVFPEFIHDVVWNHALCTIKEEVERGRRAPSKQ